jgi:hypothetical protein
MGCVSISQHLGCWQSLLGVKNLDTTHYDYVQWRGKVILISIRIVMVLGCWVKMDNPFDLFLTLLQRGRFV